MKRILMGIAAAALTVGALGTAAPAVADPDTDFANELHTYGIYGQKDYNAWIGKIMCKRVYTGVDPDVFATARFVHNQLEKDTTTDQAYQFVAAGLRTYCPEKLPILDAAADRPAG
ncbi:hypothetical protein BST22_28230 [Mycolicibacterium chubuense]|uniref:DUF732 domain-containing protein n=1 Tax=Mycolicibacterium chubuense TaxID=1800 RepID=A0A0J6WIQ7_MYCCU|nr:DUF732 domain-containing protein [Mycolicibacterium chubuense]KMO83185.1 hypothetical protein MCHUDSM44219_01444 [Mycolicibacterium chubuense]ORA42544.1 hypothetical protein BST22_28230 [Mycolicibacterium chubuense]SPX95974.1 Protein of uncharacterised function (DUF732) [Mycolicibacterium chubuense]